MTPAAATHVIVDSLPAGRDALVVVIPVVATAIAAISAALSWRSVRQARRIWSHGLVPLLVPIAVDDGRFVRLHVGNASRVLAVDVQWAMFCDGRRASQLLTQRFLAPEESADVEDVMVSRPDPPVERGATPAAIVWCRDGQGDVHVAHTDGRRWQVPRKRIEGLSALDIMSEFLDKSARDALDVTARRAEG